ncbi:MAG: hypothetical protein BWY59_00724 [Verrucomicrobia bacterium ADurb.Bin345]|nr:MAG: hypothetical protein BWY59_00724 [Verrucomicrobia bacterium ADurb.Bin345]
MHSTHSAGRIFVEGSHAPSQWLSHSMHIEHCGLVFPMRQSDQRPRTP